MPQPVCQRCVCHLSRRLHLYLQERTGHRAQPAWIVQRISEGGGLLFNILFSEGGYPHTPAFPILLHQCGGRAAGQVPGVLGGAVSTEVGAVDLVWCSTSSGNNKEYKASVARARRLRPATVPMFVVQALPPAAHSGSQP